MKSSPVVKHSVSIDGQQTSISLEKAFWTALKEIAHERGESLRHLTASINANREVGNLSSLIRLFVEGSTCIGIQANPDHALHVFIE